MQISNVSLRFANDFVGSFANFFPLCKPRVNSLIVFTAIIGMLLAINETIPWMRVIVAAIGIALVAFSAAAINCLVERAIDAKMARTAWRVSLQQKSSNSEILIYSGILGLIGLSILHFYINDLTMWLTLLTFLGYAVVYTLILKPATPMNIVIGGASGAMPPVLGWTAMTGQIDLLPLSLFLIIFLWTPPHFWALACYRREDYEKSGLPMLPITHGIEFTCNHIFLYTIMLSAVSLIPVSLAATGVVYLTIVIILDLIFLYYTIQLCRNYSDQLAKKTFKFSIYYLFILFAALFIDRLFY